MVVKFSWDREGNYGYMATYGFCVMKRCFGVGFCIIAILFGFLMGK